MERVMVFIDGSNLYHGLKEALGHARLDFQRFCSQLCGSSRRLVHVHYYNVPLRQVEDPARYARQQKFFAQLRKIPYFTIHLGRLVDRGREESCPKCSEKYTVEYQTEKGVDVQIASHMLTFAFDNQYDTAILVSEDGDFAPVVAEVLRLNKQVENAEFPRRIPSFLSRACSRVTPLDDAFLQACAF
ncbi:MAG: NYN domain-containing protein [Dehalococcoidia bacterium]|jgi:uncharacterized LabA/DUF88 family protein